MQKKPFAIEAASNRYIRGDYYVPEHCDGKPLIVFCHGFKGFKDWGEWQYGMEKICSNGFFVIAFNFSFNGIGPDLKNFSELPKFAQNTIGYELEDLQIVMDEVKKGERFSELRNTNKTGIIGHSRGGGTAILYSAQSNDINCIVTWASISNFDAYLSRSEEWRKNGFIEFENARTKQMMRMNVEFLNDIERNLSSRNILKSEKAHGLPHLIIQGDNDEAVSDEEARKLHEASNKSITKLEIIPQGTHTFGQSHPAESINPVFESVVNKTIEWFRTYLA